MKSFSGTWSLVRLILRRDRFILPIWIAVLAVIPVGVASSLPDLYPTVAERQAYADTITSNPAFLALYGPVFGTSLGALTAWRLEAGTILLVGLASLLTVVRHTRAEEEAGRRELLGATVVGRQASLFAALVVVLGANAVLGILVTGGLIAYGLPATGSVAFGLSWAVFGWTFAAVAAMTAQVTEGARAARGITIAVLGVCYLLRATGDAGERYWLSWLSPFGWAQRVRPFADERWWVFALFAGTVAVLTLAALALSARRDLGSGLLPTRLGPAVAAPSLRSPLALAWRLQRGSLLAWTAGFAVSGAVVGGVAQTAAELGADNPQLKAVIERLGGSSGLADTWFAMIMGLLALVASGYAIQAALRLNSEEEDMRVEPVLATAVSRLWWSSSHLLFAMAGPVVVLAAAGLAAGLTYGLSTGNVGEELPRVLGAALIQLPAVWVLAGITVALYGLLPRFVAFGSWATLGAFLLLGQFGELLQLDQWILDLSPFTHIPNLPGGEVSAPPLIWLVGIAVVLMVVGLIGFRRRDIV